MTCSLILSTDNPFLLELSHHTRMFKLKLIIIYLSDFYKFILILLLIIIFIIVLDLHSVIQEVFDTQVFLSPKLLMVYSYVNFSVLKLPGKWEHLFWLMHISYWVDKFSTQMSLSQDIQNQIMSWLLDITNLLIQAAVFSVFVNCLMKQ